MFCKNCDKQINEDAKFCNFCGIKIAVKESSFYKPLISFFKKINYHKLVFNRYVAILVVIIFIVWASSGEDNSYNNSGTNTPLPVPIQRTPDNAVEFAPTTPAVSLTNGTILKKNSAYLQGYGKLQIKNGTSLDAVAKLIRGGASVLTVYLKANNTYTILDISDGTYWLVFAQGLDWDSTTQKFRNNRQFSAFEDTFDFTTTDSQYTIFEITLNPVVGGTAETNDIPGNQFDQY